MSPTIPWKSHGNGNFFGCVNGNRRESRNDESMGMRPNGNLNFFLTQFLQFASVRLNVCVIFNN